MSKTLVIILNHNLPDLTNWLYYSLKKFQDSTHDIMVMDNGSKPNLIPPYTQIRLKHNVYWGGALNEAFLMVIRNPDYDSLMFLNNDIEVTPEIFVKSLRNELFRNDFAIVSPCIAGKPLPWRQMQNWGSSTPRVVNWIDNPAVLFHRKIIETIREFPPELYIGWGQEMICYDVCTEKNWKTAVCDHITILHYGKQTLLQNQLFSTNETHDDPLAGGAKNISWDEFKIMAMKTRDDYFEKHPLKHVSFEDHVKYGINYTYQPDNPEPLTMKIVNGLVKIKNTITKLFP